MGCVDCQNKSMPENNKVDFLEFISLFENPNNVTVEKIQIVRYKVWFVQAIVSYNQTVEGEEGPQIERVTKTLTLGEIN